ncbi:hypothetical protein Tco_0953680 [Tanacetum coccineum]|uniref:Uncharacterized protein n=1 Tax=Tanacetum coccineum TaxID=301880 RepID=A0ABQ5E0N2_9ASTR
MAVPKDHLRRFHGMDDAKEIWAAIKTRFGGNANSKKMQKAVLKQQFGGISIFVEKKMDIELADCYTAIKIKKFVPRRQVEKTTSRMENACGFDKRKVENVSIATILGIYARSGSLKVQRKGRARAGTARSRQLIGNSNTGSTGFSNCVERDEKLKKYRRIGMKAVKDKDALQQIFDSWSASSKNLWKLIDCGMSSTVKIGLGYGIKSNAEVLGYEEEISRGIFASRETNAGYNEIPLYSRFKQVEYKGVPPPLSGDYTPREQEDIDDSLYEYGKYGPQPQSPSPTVSDASSNVYSTCQSNDSDGEQGTVSDHSVNDDPITVPSIEQVTIATQKTQPQVPKPKQTVDPSCAQHVKTPRQPIRIPVTPSTIPSHSRQNWNQRMERELGAGYSFVRKPCFVCGSLSHLIKDCDYYEKKMAREAVFKSTRVVHADTWNINSGTQFKSGASRFNTGKQNVNSGRVNVNTARVNRPVLSNQTSQVNLKSPTTCFSKQSSPVNRFFSRNTAYKSNIYAVKGKVGTAVKTSAGCVWRKTTPHSNTNSGPTPDSNVHVSQGPQGRPKPVKAWVPKRN